MERGRTLADDRHQAASNRRAWNDGRFVSAYSFDDLRPAEARVLREYRDDVAGRVLELGCGAGRFTGHLATVARETHAIDVSQEMVDAAARRYPSVHYRTMDMADLSSYEDHSFDAVIGTFNVIDVLDDDGRRALLRDVRRLLVPGGLLVFSSHNRGVADDLGKPWSLDTSSPRSLAASVYHLPKSTVNHLRLRNHGEETDRYLVTNDPAHDWCMLLYYIDPADQYAQLEEEGYRPVACFEKSGDPVDPQQGSKDSELFYVARPA